MAMNDPRFECYADAAAVAAAAAARILDAARQAIAARGQFRLVLAGGRTPLAAYRLLAEADADWPRWHLFFGDERALPAEHPERNSLAARTALLDRVPIPAAQCRFIPAERPIAAAAAEYAALIAHYLPFDLVLLGMGEDGHTASLFPDRTIPPEVLAMPVCDAPKPPPERVSLTPAALTATRALLILVTGADKRAALAAWRAGAALPVARVAAAQGRALVLMDRAAAAPILDA